MVSKEFALYIKIVFNRFILHFLAFFAPFVVTNFKIKFLGKFTNFNFLENDKLSKKIKSFRKNLKI